MTGRPPAVVFGGTFDPPHVVHVAIARAAAAELRARSILVVPARINPQRTDSPPASAEDRLAMTRLAFRDEPLARILDLEVHRPGPSYTIDTLRTLHAHGEAPLRLLLGSDQALRLPTWREWQAVVELAEPAIVLRPPLDRAAYLAACAATFGGDVERWAGRLLSVPPVAMAATEVRAALARGESTPDLDPRVAEYVRTHRVYPPHRPSG